MKTGIIYAAAALLAAVQIAAVTVIAAQAGTGLAWAMFAVAGVAVTGNTLMVLVAATERDRRQEEPEETARISGPGIQERAGAIRRNLYQRQGPDG